MRKSHLFLTVTIVFAVVIGLFAWPGVGRPNIILISLDTLRADHFTPEHMPRTYKWLRHRRLSTTTTLACATWTKPSHVSILSGLPPETHHVVGFESKIPEQIEMIQETLSGTYYTAAFTSGGFMSKDWGFDRGFRIYWQSKDFDSFKSLYQAAWYIKNRKLPKPFFMVVHCYAPHNYSLGMPNTFAFITACTELLTSSTFMTECPFPDEEIRQWYAREVLKTDIHLKVLLSQIPRNTIVFITSDHGEYLGEDCGGLSRYGHGGPPGELLMSVPLATNWRPPIATHLDIASAILTAAEIPRPTPVTDIPQIENNSMSDDLSEQLKALGYLQ